MAAAYARRIATARRSVIRPVPLSIRTEKAYRIADHGELYDLQSDPQEVNNLWDDPSAATLRAELTQRGFDACDPGPDQIGRF